MIYLKFQINKLSLIKNQKKIIILNYYERTIIYQELNTQFILYNMAQFIDKLIRREIFISNSQEIDFQKLFSKGSQKICINQLTENILGETFLQIDSKINKINLFTVFTINSIPIIIQSNHIYLLLVKYLNKLNSKLRYGKFCVDYRSKRIQFKVQSIINKRHFHLIHSQFQKYYSRQINLISKSYLKYCIYNILYLIGKLDQKIIQKFDAYSQVQDNNNKFFNKLLKIQLMNIFQYRFIFNTMLLKNEQNESEIRQKKSQEYLITKFNQQYKQIQEQRKIYIKYLKFPIPKTSNRADSTFIFSRIQILNLNEITKNNIIKEVKYNRLYLFDANFIYTNKYNHIVQEDMILTKTLVFKEPKLTYRNQKIHSNQILKIIKDQSSVNVIKSYYTLQQELCHTVIMDYYAHTSLDCYLKKNKISLFTKLFLICQIVQGLRFLRDHEIVYLDLKPQRILLAKERFWSRLHNFELSYHPNVPQIRANRREQYTIPYAAPQIFYKNPKYDEKSDVYSLGVLMYELLFDKCPFKMKCAEELIEYYKSIEYKEISINEKMIMTPENLSYYGNEKLMIILANLCLKCMSIKQNERPYLDWILIELRQSLKYLEKLYG